MSNLEIIILALALAADAFSVGASVGLSHRRPRQIFRLSFHFGLFQALMPLIGAMAGTLLVTLIQNWDHWIVFIILTFLGGRMIWCSFNDKGHPIKAGDLTRKGSLIGLSTAVSIDALGAGVGLPAAGAPIIKSTIIIGIVAALATCIAMLIASWVERWIGTRAEVIAGLTLIGLGIAAPLDHLGWI
ncbi:MAG: manganese efflux pump MntP family protein [Calditrichota bacterium]